MEEILAKIKNLPGVLGVYLIDPEGDLLYVNSNLDNSPMDLSLLFASLKGYFSQVLELTKLGKFVDTFIDGSVGRILFSNLKNDNILVVVASNISNFGLIKFEISNAIGALEASL
ncbi:MAG: roadblock/LC7 domain-containing protein [Candidatus Atribacteria bacterium]|nr:roadblock/LC7 domain-containing protein [Candidatus Atribacteria bacterium]